MTIWMEETTIEQYIVNPTGATASTRFECGENRCTAHIEFIEDLQLNQLGLDNWNDLLSCISDGSPELSISAKSGTILVSVTADTSVCRVCNSL